MDKRRFYSYISVQNYISTKLSAEVSMNVIRSQPKLIKKDLVCTDSKNLRSVLQNQLCYEEDAIASVVTRKTSVGADTEKTTTIFKKILVNNYNLQTNPFGGSGMRFHRLIHDAKESRDCDNNVSDDTEKICQVFSKMQNSNIESSLDQLGISVSPALISNVLLKLSNAGMLALVFFRWAEKQKGFRYTTENFHAIIEALGKIKQFNLIWNMVDTMKILRLLTKDTFFLIIRRYARARKVKEAIKTFEKMKNFDLKPELSDCNQFLHILCKSKHVTKAEDIFYNMKKNRRFSPDLKTYTILLEGWGQEHDFLKTRKIYQEMLDEGFEPDTVTYGILINSYCKAKLHDKAIDLFYDMEKKNCIPNSYIYCSLINGLGSDKKLNEALRFFEQSKAKGFKPDLPTYNAVVSSYCCSMNFEGADRVFTEMRRDGVQPSCRTYNIIIHHLIKAHKTKDAHNIFQRMETELKCEPDQDTYTMIVKMFIDHVQVEMALKVWNKMRGKGLFPGMHMYSALINGLCAENRLDDACKYFQDMLDNGIRPPGQLYSSLKEVLLDAGKAHLAVKFGLKLDEIRNVPHSRW